jgi:glycine/D-amino acid oxidase-like deaminating enzyme
VQIVGVEKLQRLGQLRVFQLLQGLIQALRPAGDLALLLDALIDRVRRVCPDLAGAPVIERWAGLRPRSATRAPVLGAWPGRSGWFVLNGGFKIGFGMAPKLAQMAAGLILDGDDGIPAGFRLDEALGKPG